MKCWVVTTGSFQNQHYSKEIFTWCYLKSLSVILPPCKVLNPTNGYSKERVICCNFWNNKIPCFLVFSVAWDSREEKRGAGESNEGSTGRAGSGGRLCKRNKWVFFSRFCKLCIFDNVIPFIKCPWMRMHFVNWTNGRPCNARWQQTHQIMYNVCVHTLPRTMGLENNIHRQITRVGFKWMTFALLEQMSNH